MPRLPIDTFHLIKRLQEAGFSPAQAEAQVEVLLQLYALQETAKKKDVIKLRFLVKRDIALTQAKLQEVEAKLRAEIEKVRADVREIESRLRVEIEKVHAEVRETEARLRVELEKVRAEVENNRLEVEKLRLTLQETEKRFLLHLNETEARLRTDILRAQVRVIMWVAGLIAAQIPIFYLLKSLLPF